MTPDPSPTGPSPTDPSPRTHPSSPDLPSVVRTRPGPILVAAVLASSTGYIDFTVIALALPANRESLGASQAQADRVGAAYLLALSALILS